MKQLIQCELFLLTPTGRHAVPVKITYTDDENAIAPKSKISLLYDGTVYEATGSDYLWVDTFADLQRRLPDHVKLACCMTCRHGNMCPYGNIPNQLFCTKQLLITGKEDICHLFDQSRPHSERAVSSLDYCGDFAPQSDDHYTYNDYLYQLRSLG